MHFITPQIWFFKVHTFIIVVYICVNFVRVSKVIDILTLYIYCQLHYRTSAIRFRPADVNVVLLEIIQSNYWLFTAKLFTTHTSYYIVYIVGDIISDEQNSIKRQMFIVHNNNLKRYTWGGLSKRTKINFWTIVPISTENHRNMD